MLSRRSLLQMASVCPVMASSMILGQWTVKSEMPYPVQEIYPALHKNQIVVAGGIYAKPDKSLGITKSVIAYDLNTNRWLNLPDLPEPAHHPMLVSHGNKLYAFSGFVITEAGNWTASQHVWFLNEQESKWQTLDESQMPHAMCETAAMTIGNSIHIATGRYPKLQANGQWRDQIDHNKHLIFDVVTKEWRQGPDTLTARNSAASAVVDGRWYVVGGRTVEDGNVAHNEMYDPKENSWTAMKPMPQAQGGLAAASVGKMIYAIGGEYFNGGGGVYAEVWAYDTKKDNWELADKMPVPRHGLGALTYNDKIYIVGGAAKVGGNDTTARLSVFTP